MPSHRGAATLKNRVLCTLAMLGPLAGCLQPSPIEAPSRLDFNGREYYLSCGAVKPGLVDPIPLSTSDGSTAAMGLPLHRIEGVDPAVMVAVPKGECSLGSDQVWASAVAADEYSNGTPSAPYNEAWCMAAQYGADPAEGFSC